MLAFRLLKIGVRLSKLLSPHMDVNVEPKFTKHYLCSSEETNSWYL